MTIPNTSQDALYVHSIGENKSKVFDGDRVSNIFTVLPDKKLYGDYGYIEGYIGLTNDTTPYSGTINVYRTETGDLVQTLNVLDGSFEIKHLHPDIKYDIHCIPKDKNKYQIKMIKGIVASNFAIDEPKVTYLGEIDTIVDTYKAIFRVDNCYGNEEISTNNNLTVSKIKDDIYMLSGIPTIKDYVVNVFEEYNGTYRTSSTNANISVKVIPTQARNMVYELPYRVLKELDPNLDSKIATNSSYYRIGVLSEKNQKFIIGDDVYIYDGTTYNVVNTVSYTTTFNNNTALDNIQTTFTISSVIGTVVANKVIIVENERMYITHYDSSTSTVTVTRGIDGTLPTEHGSNLLIYIESVNVISGEYNSTNNPTIKISTKTFSDTFPLASITANNVVGTGLAAKPYPPINVKFNGGYVLDEVLDTLNITYGHNDKTNHLNYYNDTLNPSTGQTYNIDIYDSTNTTLINSTMTILNNHTLDYSAVTELYFYVRIYTRINNIDSFKQVYKIKRFTAPRSVVSSWNDQTETVTLNWVLD